MRRKIFGSWETFRRVFHLIVIWFVIGIGFGVLYYYLPGDLLNINGESIKTFWESIYFSFVTILTIGYGDIFPIGFIRILTVIEGLIGWIIFGIIVYKIVSVKEDLILQEIHQMSNEQYISKIRNNLFISNTNLSRFIKDIKTKKISKSNAIYEIGVISTAFEANIGDASSFFCRDKPKIIGEISEEDLLLTTKAIELCLTHLKDALELVNIDEVKKDGVIQENIENIIEHSRTIYNFCNIHISSKKSDVLKTKYRELKKFLRY